MKKVVILGVIAAAAISSASAQGISVGPRIGVNFANMTASEGRGAEDGFPAEEDFFNDNSESQTGISAGLAINIGVTEAFSIQPEILYSQQGYKLDYSESFAGAKVTAKADIKTNYLQVPVFAKYSFGSGNVKFFINAGPYAAFLLGGSGNREIKAEGFGQSYYEAEDIKFKFDQDKDRENYGYEINRLDAGLVAGAGFGINAGPGMVTIDVRYNHGLSNMLKPQPEDEDYKEANRFFGVGVTYLFGMGE